MSTLLIVGASARAAAASAVRAGFRPWCADLFGDLDLRAIVPDAVRCPADRYPEALADLLRQGPPGPWIYTGGLENHPRLIARMAADRPLWGNSGDALRLCRDPFAVHGLLRDAGLPAPDVQRSAVNLPGRCRWLRKPLRGSAGQGIAFAGTGPAVRSRRHFYQEYIEGRPMSAVFVRARGAVTLLGVTGQLIGIEWLNAPPFRYCGNIGPVELSAGMRTDLRRTGQVLGDGCGLVGIFGVDFIERDDRAWVVEVNPRYPASVEVLERATGLAALHDHRTAFDPTAEPRPAPPRDGRCVGKAIVYAPRRLVMPELRIGGPDDGVSFADVPAAGEVVEEGWPVLTMIAMGRTSEECIESLEGAVRRFMQSVSH